MDDLISRTNIISRLYIMRNIAESHGMEYDVEVISKVLSEVRNEPIVEAQPVKHGQWIDDWICSECNYGSPEPNMPYCPNCGSYMKDGEGE